MNLKSAVGFSVLVHVGLLMFRQAGGAIPQEKGFNSIQVTYTDTDLPPAVLSKTERIHAEPVLSAPVRPTPVVPMPVPSKPAVSKIPREPPHPILRFDLSPPPPLPKGAANFSEDQFDALRYKQMIRQHLKNRLIYPPEPIEGTVHVRIVLDPAGMLRQVAILQASDSRLAEMAVEGIRSAAPYPRFPSGLKDPQADYDFLVQYRLD